MECCYCGKTFKNKYILKTHQQTTKYCIKLQERKVDRKVDRKVYVCEYCESCFTSNNARTLHLKKCKLIYEKGLEKGIEKGRKEFSDIIEKLNRNNEGSKDTIEILEKNIIKLESHIERLEERLENIAIKGATKSTTNTQINNIVNKLEPLTQEHMEDCVQFLTKKHIKDGPTGLAEYAVEFPFKNRLICVDFDRRKLKYKDSSGETITDLEMTKMSKPFFKAIYQKSGDILNDLNKNVYNKDDFDMEGTKKIVDAKMCIDDAVQGKKTDFSNKFVKEICIRTIAEL